MCYQARFVIQIEVNNHELLKIIALFDTGLKVTCMQEDLFSLHNVNLNSNILSILNTDI